MKSRLVFGLAIASGGVLLVLIGFLAGAFRGDPKAYTDGQFERIRNGFAAINVGQMIIQRTHPTGSYVFSNPPQLVLSADRHEIIGKVTVKWTGGLTGA